MESEKINSALKLVKRLEQSLNDTVRYREIDNLSGEVLKSIVKQLRDTLEGPAG